MDHLNVEEDMASLCIVLTEMHHPQQLHGEQAIHFLAKVLRMEYSMYFGSMHPINYID